MKSVHLFVCLSATLATACGLSVASSGELFGSFAEDSGSDSHDGCPCDTGSADDGSKPSQDASFDVDSAKSDALLCGNGIIDSPEVCDIADFGVKSCATETTHPDYIGGLVCKDSCSAIDVSACQPKTCTSGSPDMPISVSATGSGYSTAYLHTYAEADQYSIAVPATVTLTGKTNPSQAVLTGQTSIWAYFTYSGGSPLGENFYLVDASAVALCAGADSITQACDARVARDFRCTFYPAEEAGGCTDVKAVFASLGQRTSYSVAGYTKILASVRCK